MQQTIMFSFAIFVALLAVIELVLYSYRNIRYPDRGKLSKRLSNISSGHSSSEAPDILKKRTLSEVPFLNKILLSLKWVESFERLRTQANSKYPLGFYILLTPALALTGYLTLFFILPTNTTVQLLGCLAGFLPFFMLNIKRKRRMEKFMRQLPEALDLMARSLRAGHAFTSGMKMVADQFDDPLGQEFAEALDQISYGISVHDALEALTKRVDCPDLRFFVVSVILQRETGGNLAEIVEGIAHLIRERFKFHGKVRALAAEGKISAYILIALPFAIGFIINFLNPDYMNILLSESSGRKSLYCAGILMTIGIVYIRKMIRIRV